VIENEASLAELRRLGARSVPVLSRGDDFVFAQNIADVIRFLGLNEVAGPALSPAEFVARLDRFLSAAERFIPQMPHALLAKEVPGRPRTYRVLGHHMFRVVEAFLEVAAGAALTYDGLTTPPSESMQSSDDIVTYGNKVHRQLAAWWATKADKSGQESVQTYYGIQSLAEYLERTTWHVGQHVRQWMMLLRTAGIEPDIPLDDRDFAGLPMPAAVWDG
jgi:hypothetical protein